MSDRCRVQTRIVVSLSALCVLQPLLQYWTQFAGVLIAQLKVLEATDCRLTEYTAVSASQRIPCNIITCTRYIMHHLIAHNIVGHSHLFLGLLSDRRYLTESTRHIPSSCLHIYQLRDLGCMKSTGTFIHSFIHSWREAIAVASRRYFLSP